MRKIRNFSNTTVQISEKHQQMMQEIEESVRFRRDNGKGYVKNSRKVEYLIEVCHDYLCAKQQ